MLDEDTVKRGATGWSYLRGDLLLFLAYAETDLPKFN